VYELDSLGPVAIATKASCEKHFSKTWRTPVEALLFVEVPSPVVGY
jgi:hypothetical protein